MNGILAIVIDRYLFRAFGLKGNKFEIMKHVDSEEASSDDTIIISELLNSAEAMQTSVAQSNATSVHLHQKDGLHSVENNRDKQNIMVMSLPETNVRCLSEGGDSGEPILNSQYADMDDMNKMHIRHVHIPYILNGELYQIQTQDGENVTVKCCHCPPDRVYRGSVRSTGNFHMHIKRRHPDLLEKLHDMKVNALLERRDRLMRNRKITNRNTRNRSSAIHNPSSIGGPFKNEDKSDMMITEPDSQIPLDSTPELSLMHTHNLKIKTVFQRHQMQQREAAELRNWNNVKYVVMPIEKLAPNEDSDQPINYSLKSQEGNENIITVSSSFQNNKAQSQQLQQHPQYGREKEQNSTQTSYNDLTNLTNHQKNLSNTGIEHDEFTCENQTSTRNLSTSSSTSSPSVISSSLSNHYHNMERNQQYNDPLYKHHHLSIIKPEHLLGSESEAIDLTMHTDSGIFSNSDDNINDQNNVINNISSRAGSQTTNTTTVDAGLHSDNTNCNNDNNFTNSIKWQELLMQIENSLCDMQREMNVRNQIESNRMFLDIAKFKFLHPGFQFNW